MTYEVTISNGDQFLVNLTEDTFPVTISGVGQQGIKGDTGPIYARFDDIADLAASDELTDGEYYTASSAFNGEPETFLYDADSTATADGALIVTATGMGAGRLVSTRTVYADFDELDSDTRGLTEGTALRWGDFGYTVAASGATDHHLTTAGGVKLYVLPDSNGYNVLAFGAVADFSFADGTGTDNTSSIQAAIDACGTSGVAYVPDGSYKATTLTTGPGVTLLGDGPGYSYIAQEAGETDPLLIDNGSAANSWVKDISFDGRDNNHTSGIVNLGELGTQLGTNGGMHRVFIRNSLGTGLISDGNVAYYDNVEIYDTDTGFVLKGTANKCRNIVFSNMATTGLEIRGQHNDVSGVYGESSLTEALVHVIGSYYGNSLSNVSASVNNNTYGALIRLGALCYNTVIRDSKVILSGTGVLTNGLIFDETTGTRKTWGINYANIYYSVPSYVSGTRTEMPYISVPTDGTHRQGDYFNGAAGADGLPSGWICIAGGTPGTWTPQAPIAGVVNKTASETLTSSDNGRRFSNNGATSVVTLTLPVASVGMRWHFTRRNSTHAFRIDPSTSFLWPPGNSKYVQLDGDGSSVTIEYIASNQYAIISQSGTISYEP